VPVETKAERLRRVEKALTGIWTFQGL
jgi:hypothetical protein